MFGVFLLFIIYKLDYPWDGRGAHLLYGLISKPFTSSMVIPNALATPSPYSASAL